MSILAWRILALFIDHAQRLYKGDYSRGYIAAWTLGIVEEVPNLGERYQLVVKEQEEQL